MFRYIIPAALAMISVNSHAVVGGQTVSDQDWPYTVSLRQIEGTESDSLSNHRCGGAYIGEGLILTAAHCVALAPVENSVACIGGSGDASENNCYRLADVRIHPDFESEFYTADLAIYKLAWFSSPDNYPAAKIITAEQDALITAGETLHILGLGSTRYESYDPAYRLQGAEIAIASEADCNEQTAVQAPAGFDASNFICGGEQTKGPAPGDSGTPAFIEMDQGMIYTALVSHGYNYMGVFTRLGLHLDWINSTREELTPNRILDVGDDQQWLLSAQQPTIEHQQLITNISTEAVDIVAIEIRGDASVTLISHNCGTLNPNKSCEVSIAAQQPENSYGNAFLDLELSSGITYTGVRLTTVTMGDIPGIANWQSEFQSWLAGGTYPWSAFEDRGIMVPEYVDTAQFLQGELTGPGVLQFSSQSLTASGDGRLQVRLDDAVVIQMNGDCQAEQLAVAVPEGTHQITFDYEGTNQFMNNGSIVLSDLVFNDQASATGSLTCHYVKPEYFPEGENDTVIENSGGSSSLGWLSLLPLFVMRLLRRR
ncbi:serine protease [Corallincola luteus]|uniref:Serine protease n=1 Tax=Corallincola luteus TaxID=1775177 RepID=A0ABY2AMX0_9GAMM|nr:serine protease [Corallincola luteus]TCI03980.1 serine protease [Corallincola luteus]